MLDFLRSQFAKFGDKIFTVNPNPAPSIEKLGWTTVMVQVSWFKPLQLANANSMVTRRPDHLAAEDSSHSTRQAWTC